MDTEDLRKYSEAWNAHDIEKIMRYMTDDCAFETGGRSEKYGTRFEEVARNVCSYCCIQTVVIK